MLNFITFLSIMASLLFMYTSYPLGLALLVIFQSILLAMALYLSTLTSWFSFIILMIFISGMMIIFMYVSALASNDLESYSPSIMYPLIIYTLLMMVMFPLNKSLVPWSNFYKLLLDWAPTMNYKIYSPLIVLISTMLFIYMLMSMMVVIKNSALMKGPLSIK